MQDILLFLENHWTLSLPLVIVLILLMVIEFIKQKSAAANITPVRLTQLINHENAAVVDIRSPEQYAQGHIIGSVSIPMAELTDKPKKLDKFKTKPIVLVCTTGPDAVKAAALLLKEGLNVLVLGGGIRSWREASMPLIKD